MEGWEEDDYDVHMTDEGETSGTGLVSRMRDLGRPDYSSFSRGLYGDVAEYHFCCSTHKIGQRLLGWAMTPKEFFTSSEDEQYCIENSVIKRKPLIPSNASLIIDLEAPAREDAEQQGIDIEEMDRIDLEIDWQALLNMPSQ